MSALITQSGCPLALSLPTTTSTYKRKKTYTTSLLWELRGGGGGGGGKRHFFSFHICDRAAEDEQVEKNRSKSDHAFLRYCAPKSEVYL